MSQHLTDTAFWTDLCHGIFGPRQGGARIIVDAEDAKTGVGKTGLAVYIARLLAKAFNYEITPDDLTLSGAKYLERWREHPGADQPSVLILDELGGAGAGHARRAMANQNVDLGNAWQLMRKKRIVSIVTLPHWSKADKDLRQQADYRLWCRKRPIGYFKPYQVGATFDDGTVQTKGYDSIDQIRFPNMHKQECPVYHYLTGEKDELLESEFFDADKLHEDSDEQLDPEEAKREQKIDIAQNMRRKGMTTREVADAVDMSHTWVVENTSSQNGVQADD